MTFTLRSTVLAAAAGALLLSAPRAAPAQEGSLETRSSELTAIPSLEGMSPKDQRELYARFQDLIPDFLESGEINQGLAVARKELELFPDEAKSHLDVGAFLLWSGRPDEALRSFQDAAKKKTTLYDKPAPSVRALALNNASAILVEQKKFKAARANLDESMRLDSNQAQTYFLLGTVNLETKKLEEAKKYYAEAVELDPRAGTPIDYLRYATCHRKLKEQEESTKVLRKALEIYPLEPALYYYLGATYIDALAYLDAYFAFQTEFYIHRKRSPVYQQNLDLLGVVFERGREVAEDGKPGYKYPYLGHMMRAQELVTDHPAKAIEHYQAVIAKRPQEPMTYVFMGEAYLAAGEAEKARDALLSAVKLNPYLVPAYLDLARAYKETGQETKAQAAFERAVFIDPENWKIQSVIETLKEQQGEGSG